MFSIFSIKPPKCRSCSWKKTTFFMYQTTFAAHRSRVIGWTKLFIWEMQPGNRLQFNPPRSCAALFRGQKCTTCKLVCIVGRPKMNRQSTAWNSERWKTKRKVSCQKGNKLGYIGQFQKSDAVGLEITVKMFEFSYRSQEAGVASFPPENYNDIGESPRLMGDTCSNGCFFPLSLASFAGVYLSGWRYIHVWDRESWYLNLYFAAVTGGVDYPMYSSCRSGFNGF